MNKNIETLATALYVKIDDLLEDWPDLRLPRPATTTPVTLSDAELLMMAVMPALLGFTSERRWLRYVNGSLASPPWAGRGVVSGQTSRWRPG